MMIPNTYKFIKLLLRKLREVWIVDIKYPKLYKDSSIKSILSPEILNNAFGLFVGKGVQIKNSKINIGKHTYIGNNTLIDSCIFIGAFCSISSDVKIGMPNHPLDYISTSPVFYGSYRKWVKKNLFNEREIKTVIIEEDVLISANVVILNGVRIGRGAVIGAGAVVTKDVPPYAIVAGVPAKIIRYRFSAELIEKIESSEWWKKEDAILKQNLKYANNSELFLSKL